MVEEGWVLTAAVVTGTAKVGVQVLEAGVPQPTPESMNLSLLCYCP